MWASHHYLVVSFVSSSVSEWKMALNTWDNTEDVYYKYQSPNHIVESDKDIDAMAFYAPNSEEVGKYDGL